VTELAAVQAFSWLAGIGATVTERPAWFENGC